MKLDAAHWKATVGDGIRLVEKVEVAALVSKMTSSKREAVVALGEVEGEFGPESFKEQDDKIVEVKKEIDTKLENTKGTIIGEQKTLVLLLQFRNISDQVLPGVGGGDSDNGAKRTPVPRISGEHTPDKRVKKGTEDDAVDAS